MNSSREFYNCNGQVPQVMCPRSERGCLWTGDYRHILHHESECPYGDSVLLQDLCTRMDTWDKLMEIKEKEVELLQLNLNEVKDELNKSQNEIMILTSEKNKIEGEVLELREENRELQRHLEHKIDNLATSRKKDNANQKQNIHEIRENLNQKQEEINEMRREAGKMKEEVNANSEISKEAENQLELRTEKLVLKNEAFEKKFEESEKKMLMSKQQLQQDIGQVRLDCKYIKHTVETAEENLSKQFEELQITTKDHVTTLKNDVVSLKSQMNETRSYLKSNLTDKEHMIDRLSARTVKIEKEAKDNHTSLSKKVKDEIEDREAGVKIIQDSLDEARKITDTLQHHVGNIENIIFCDYADGSSVTLQWKLQNYQYYQKLGERVCSPIFFTQLQGYRFKLFIEWSGLERDKLDLCLMLCSGSNYDEPLERFKMAYTLEMQDNQGNIMSYAIPLRQIESHTGKCFTIQPGASEAEYGFGCAPFLTMPELTNYIVNDMLSINCRITPL